MTSSAAAVSQGFNIEIPSKVKEGQFFVFYVADQIDGQVKVSNPTWAAGGVLRPKFASLRHRGGYIRKCEITQLLPQMVSEPISNIHPGERKHLIPTYKINQNGVSQPIGVTKTGQHDGLLRTEWHPSEEIGRIVGSGIVRMPVENAGEALRAQYFLFPEWDQIMDGTAFLSRRVSDLRAHFESRVAAAEDDFERKVAGAAISSCEEYSAWARRATATANAEYERMKVKGMAWPIGMDAELAFDQVGIQRPDNLIQQQGNNMDKLTEAVTLLLKRETGDQKPPVDPEYAEFLEWKAAQAAKTPAQEKAEPAPLTPGGDRLAVGTFVTVDGRVAKIISPSISIFGTPGAKVEFLDDQTTKGVKDDKITVIEEEK